MSEVQVDVLVTNIIWDTDSEDRDDDDIAHEIDWLPDRDELLLVMDYDYTEDHLLEEIADTLSDEYGFLVYDYDYEVVAISTEVSR